MKLNMHIEEIISILEDIKIDNIDDIYITALDVVEDILQEREESNKSESYLNIKKYIKQKIFIKDKMSVDSLEVFIQFINEVYQKSLEYKTINALLKNNSIKNNFRKNNGIYYTDLSLAKKIAKQTIQSYIQSNQKIDLSTVKFLEPCSGSGIFVIAYIEEMLNLKVDIENILKNIYIVDIDEKAIYLYKRLLKIYLYVRCNYTINFEDYKNNINTDGLLFKIKENKISKINIEDIFNNVINDGGFDIVITNPPYKLLKAEKNKYDTNENYENDKTLFKKIADYIKKNKTYKYSNEGTLNYYKLFIEEILEQYTKDNSSIGLLIPQNILADKSCTKLRKHIIKNYNLDNWFCPSYMEKY